jgi:preprotein translocase subunit SecE
MAVQAARTDEGNLVTRSKDFVEESFVELKKVTWPDYPQLKNATFVVLGFVIVLSFVIYLMDVVIRFGVEQIMGLFGA